MEFKLSASNAALSGLLYDCCNSESDQIGFLIGKTAVTMEVVINDSQEPSSKKVVSTDILSTLPVSVFSFYNAAGTIIEDQLRHLIGHLPEQIVGWYVYRRNSVNSLSLRDSLIDRQLRKMIADRDGKFFIVCVVSEQKDNNSTIEIEYTFYGRDRTGYVPIKVFVDNLAESGIDFKKSSSVVERLDLFRKIDLDKAFKDDMPKFIEHYQEEVGSIFQHLSVELCQSEEEIIKLKSRLKKLQPESESDCQLQQFNLSVTNATGNSHTNHYPMNSGEPCQPVKKQGESNAMQIETEKEPSQNFSQEY
nr:PREDICTED: BRISC complex subunit Abro1-like [Bemisia tabaci]